MQARWLAAAGILLAAVALVFSRVLAGSVSFLIGDNLTHSLPVHHLMAKALHEGSWRFWNPQISFGFPFYAEGTGGWFHPWELLLVATLPLVTAHDLVYLSSFFLTGLSCLLVLHALGVGPGLALVGGLAVSFSPAVLGDSTNVAYAHALAWSGLGLWAFERWYQKPDARRVALLGVALGLAILAGYPPIVYALLFFLGVVMAIRLAFDRRSLAAHLLGLPVALAIGLGLSAFQVLPLVELMGQSVRRGAIASLQAYPWQNYVVGFVFDADPALYAPGRFSFFIAPLGSALAFVAILFLPLLRGRVAWSYIGAIALCVAAAVGSGSAVFELFRALLPGFDRLRIISPFLLATVVPTGVVLGLLLREAVRPQFSRTEIALCAGSGVLFALMLASSWPAHAATPYYRSCIALELLGVAAALAVLRRTRRLAWAPALLVVALLAEIAAVKGSFLTLLPRSILAENHEIASFLAARQREDPDARAVILENKSYDEAFRGLVLQHWKTPNYASFARRSLHSLTPFSNLLADVSMIQANDSGPLAEIPALRDAMQAELRREGGLAPGLRLIDRFRVRFVIVEGDPAKTPVADGLDVVWRDPAGGVAVLENSHVQPKYQWHPAADPGDLTLPGRLPGWIESLPWVEPESEGVVELTAPAAGRVFVSIPRYPGWSAFVDGERVPILAADGVGMDVPLAAGTHRLELRFVPSSFHLGLCVAAASAIAALGIALWRPRAP